MKIENLSSSGKSFIWHTAQADPNTLKNFKRCNIKEGAFSLPYKSCSIEGKVTKEGAIYHFMFGKQPQITVLCCFGNEYSDLMYQKIKNYELGVFGPPRKPALPCWLYAAIKGIRMPLNEVMEAPTVECYIYCALLAAR